MSKTLQQEVVREIERKNKLKLKIEKRIENKRARMHRMGKEMRADELLLEQLTSETYKAAVGIEENEKS